MDPDTTLRIRTPPPDISDEFEMDNGRKIRRGVHCYQLSAVVVGSIGAVALIKEQFDSPIHPPELQVIIGILLVIYCIFVISMGVHGPLRDV